MIALSWSNGVLDIFAKSFGSPEEPDQGIPAEVRILGAVAAVVLLVALAIFGTA